MPWGAIASAVVGGLFSNSANKSASKANQAAIEAMLEGRKTGLAYLNQLYPYQASGLSALYGLNRLTGQGPRSAEEAQYLQMLAYGAPGTGSSSDISAIQAKIDELQNQAGTTGEENYWTDDRLAELNYLQGQLKEAEQSNADISAYNEKLAQLKAIVDQQKNDPNYAVGADYLRNLPGYQFREQQGLRALGTNQAARGQYFSGKALKELTRFGQGLADQSYNDEYQRLLQQAGLGAQVPIAQANIATGNAAGLANIYQQQGNNAWNYANSMNNATQSAIANYTYANALKGQQPPSSSYNNTLGSEQIPTNNAPPYEPYW